MNDSRAILAYLLDCFDSTYRVLGESAPLLTNDAYVVRAYEASRAFGEVALALREEVGDVRTWPVTALEDVLGQSVADDPSGAMTLCCLASIVGPRLLVSIRDAREAGDFEVSAEGVLNRAAEVVVRETYRVAEAATGDPIGDDETWQRQVRRLIDRLEMSGNAESFGLSR